MILRVIKLKCCEFFPDEKIKDLKMYIKHKNNINTYVSARITYQKFQSHKRC